MGGKRGLNAAMAVLLVGLVSLGHVDRSAAAPTLRNTTLTIEKGGDRNGPQTVAGLAGATFDFFAGFNAVPPGDLDAPTASCTTGADGMCSVDVPGRTGFGNGYWIRERTAPAGFSIIPTLDIGPGSATVATTYNRLHTGPVSNNVHYVFPMAGTGNYNYTARSDFWADRRDNPPMPGQCGLNIALLMDVSGSIEPYLPQVKSAADGFVDALTGTPSQIAVFKFSTNASGVIGPTAVPNAAAADTVKAAINGLTAGGGTNWDAGLFHVAAVSSTFDAVIMLTDGNPTYYGPPPVGGPGFNTRFREVENGVFSANAVKALGTRVVAVGVGSGVTNATNNLKSISGPVAGSDYVQTDYAQLAAEFRKIALETCAGTVNVVKMVIPPTGTIADGVPAEGWTMTVTSGNATPTSAVTAAGSGAASFSADLEGAPSVPVTIEETLQSGYSLVQNAGQNATCTKDGTAVASTNAGATGFTVDAARNAIVSCTIYNRAPLPPAEVIVNKEWVIDGVTYQDPAQPADFQAALSLTGQTKPVWGQVYGGYNAGDVVTIGETLDTNLLPPGCSVVLGRDRGTHVLKPGLNRFTLTNTLACTTTLKLWKEVANPYGPPAAPTEWTLSAYAPSASSPLISGTSGVSGTIKADLKYSLAETSVPGYAQQNEPDAVIVPPATGSWHCALRLKDGTLGPEYDGLDGTVIVELGHNAECKVINLAQPAKLTLRKAVTNAHGGAAVPVDWVLNAIPSERADAVPISGRDGEAAVTGAMASPGTKYALSENDGPDGYAFSGVSCVLTGTSTGVPTPGNVLTLELAQDVTCTFGNADLPAPPTPTPSPSSSSDVPPLPATGERIAPLVGLGSALLLFGLVVLLLLRHGRRLTQV